MNSNGYRDFGFKSAQTASVRFSEQVTPVVLTFNEAPNIARSLESLKWAKRVVVLDSLSTDATPDLARAFPNVSFHQRAFDTHTTQWNYALSLADTDWVLSLDADYILPAQFREELEGLNPSSATDGFAASFRYCIQGRPLRAALYPPRVVLFRRTRSEYVQDGHTQLLRVRGETASLKTTIDHDDRKPLERWLWAQDKYARLEVEKLLTTPRHLLRAQDRLRLWILPAAFVVLFYTLVIKRTVFDGWPGWLYAFQRMTAELILSMHLVEEKLKSRKLKN